MNKKLYLKETCTKCGPKSLIKVEYHWSGWLATHWVWCKDTKEHISKNCLRCGYGWIEKECKSGE